MARRIAIATVAVDAALLLLGCGGFPRNEPGQGFGQITLSSPRIEGRERLINDRREQELWLNEQLKRLDQAEFGVSGEVDLRSLTVTALQAAASKDPNIKLDDVNRARQAELLRQAADDERALGTFRAAQRDQILAEARTGKVTSDEAIEKLKKLGLDPSSAKPSSTDSAAGQSVPGVPARPESQVSAKTDGTKFAPPTDVARASKISSTPIEAFQDLLAAREILRNERNDVRLDDLHDLAGNTLYRLTLNAEVLPADDASAWAVARLRVKLPTITEESVGPVLAQAREQFAKRLDESTRSIERVLLRRLNRVCWEQEAKAFPLAQEPWSSAEHERAFRRAMRCATSDLDSRTRAQLEQLIAERPLANISFGSDNAEPAWTPSHLQRVRMQDLLLARQGPVERRDLYDTRRRLLSRWSVWLGELIDDHTKNQRDRSVLNCIEGLNVKVQSTCLGITGTTPEQRLKSMLKRAMSASVYAVTPKETVQRLSEVASNRKVSELMLSLSALTGSAGVSAGLQSIRAHDAFYSALRRQPLVVGITEAGHTCSTGCGQELVFGWVIGPSFQLSNDGKSSRFRHTVVQRSVSAELVLPAWLDHIVMERETFWVREDGTVVPAITCRPSVNKACPADELVVRLPAQPIEALEAADARHLREPRVDKHQYLDVVEGERAAVLITGQNVWRSTEVLIGSQRAELLTVLPDNAGILASFGPIQTPYGADTPERGQVLLTLVTSDGRVEAGRVTVASERPASTGGDARKLEITGYVPRVVASAEHAFELSQPLKVAEGLVVRIGSKKDVNLRVLLDKTTQLGDDRKRVVFAVPATSVPNLKTGNSIVVDVLVTRPSGGVEVFNVVEGGTYYEKDADIEATVTAARIRPTDPIKLKMALPPGSVGGFKSLTKGAARVVATVEWPGASAPWVVESDCPIRTAAQNSCEAVLAASGAVKEALVKMRNADIKLTVLLTGDDTPRLKGDPVAVRP